MDNKNICLVIIVNKTLGELISFMRQDLRPYQTIQGLGDLMWGPVIPLSQGSYTFFRPLLETGYWIRWTSRLIQYDHYYVLFPFRNHVPESLIFQRKQNVQGHFVLTVWICLYVQGAPFNTQHLQSWLELFLQTFS